MKTSTRKREIREDGFTLIEILVVIIIIGILAVVAIPIFLNQQRTARDSATIQDTRNLASAVETALVAKPEATKFNLTQSEATSDTMTLSVGNPGDMSEPMSVSKTLGTEISVHPKDDGVKAIPGQYVILAWNQDGQEYTGLQGSKYAAYDTSAGGLGERPGSVVAG